MPTPRKTRKTDEAGLLKLPVVTDGFIRFEVDEISSLRDYDDGPYSPEVEVRGGLWRANVYRKAKTFFLYLYYVTNQDSPWRIEADVEYSLVHSNSKKTITVKRSETFTEKHEFRGENLMKWDDLMDEKKGFMKDDKITVEIRFWITKMSGIRTIPYVDFTDPKDPRHDVALVIEGEKVYASKQILAVNSSVFNAMFYGEFVEKDMKEIELKDVNREELIELLNVTYPSCKRITAETVEYLLELADRFQIVRVIEKAEKFMIDSNKFSYNDLLRIADKYRLFGLMDHCLSALDTKQEFKDIKESSIYNDLSDATKAVLFEHLLEAD